MNVIDCEQNTPEWHAARCGRVTASRVADIVRKGKGGPSKMRETYAGELVAERLSGYQAEGGFTSAAMQWGKDHEDEAAANYAFMHDVAVSKVGIVIHPRIEMAAASPDRLAGDDGLLEIKCPNTATHIATLLGARIDPDYEKQIQWQLACTDRKWCDFISFDPRLPVEMQMAVKRYERDPIVIADLEREVAGFLIDVDRTVAELQKRYAAVPEAAE